MKVIIDEKDLLIIPDTKFEEDYLSHFIVKTTFHKTGLTPMDYIGLKIVREEP